MKCPSCAEEVPDDSAICPKCDAVLDTTGLDNSPPEADGPTEPQAKPLKSGPGGGPKKPMVKKPLKKGSTGSKPIVKAKSPSMPEAPARKVREARAPSEDWHAKPEYDRAPPPKPAGDGYHMVDPEDFWTEVKRFVADLSTADKLAFLGAFGALVSCFFPWKDTITEGDVLGLMSLGAFVFAVSMLILGAIVIRVRKVMPALHALVPWLIQFGGACFCIVWCLVYVKLSWDSTMARSPIGNFERWVSSPSPGVFIALLMSIMTLGGTLMGLKEKPQ